MVLCTNRTLLKGKNTDEQQKHRRQWRGRASSPSSSIKSIKTTRYSSSEGTADKLIWPSRREDCEWMADKVTLGDKHAELDSEAFKDDIVSYGAHYAPPKTRRKRRNSRKKAARRASCSTVMTTVTDSKNTKISTRQPLGDITLDFDRETNESSSSAFRPACTVPSSWHRALFNLLSQAEKERAGGSKSS